MVCLTARHDYLLAGRMHVLMGLLTIIILDSAIVILDGSINPVVIRIIGYVIATTAVACAADVWIHFYRH